MKKLLLLSLVCLLVLGIQAQESEIEHLQFMGIPINGPIKTFQSELSKKGFKRQSSSTKGTRTYTGVFSGEDVELRVAYDINNKNVYRVAVLIPCYRNPDAAFRKYNDYKSRLENKYKAYELSAYSSIYDNDGVRLEEDIKNGTLKSLNSSREWVSGDNRETCIFLSKPTLFRYFENDSLHFASVFMHCYGNIGTITIKTFKIPNSPFSYEAVKYENGLFIIYDDGQNSKKINKKDNEDL